MNNDVLDPSWDGKLNDYTWNLTCIICIRNYYVENFFCICGQSSRFEGLNLCFQDEGFQ